MSLSREVDYLVVLVFYTLTRTLLGSYMYLGTREKGGFGQLDPRSNYDERRC